MKVGKVDVYSLHYNFFFGLQIILIVDNNLFEHYHFIFVELHISFVFRTFVFVLHIIYMPISIFLN